jgi:hypothetical protein
VNGYLIRKGDDPQVTAVELGYGTPESESILLLRFHADRIVNDLNAPLLLQIRPLA